MVSMVQAAQNDAGEVDGLSEVAHQRALESNYIPPEGEQNGHIYSFRQIAIQFVSSRLLFMNHRDKETKVIKQ